LGAAAGGGFPQWNSNAEGCRRARSGERRGRGMGAMMEVSVTLKDDDIQTIATYLAHKP